ncbi:MAG TPA: formate dehydrogenase accessory protein FdhE, partial [Thermoanaerobaculia bacterium]|nr:formate dehydrogenase accessory protein FdhE [Thermoanaerobaculia bacterium]
MMVATSVRAEFERRSARADALPPSDILSFVSVLCRAQGTIAAALESAAAVDFDHLLPLAEPFLRIVADRGPEQLVEQALIRLDDDGDTARARLLTYWRGESTARDDYLSRAILRPYTEVLRTRGATLDRVHNPGHCPYCGGPPIVSTRRALPDAEAGMRMLHCALCGLEWNFNR